MRKCVVFGTYRIFNFRINIYKYLYFLGKWCINGVNILIHCFTLNKVRDCKKRALFTIIHMNKF